MGLSCVLQSPDDEMSLVHQGWISPCEFLVPGLSVRVKLTNEKTNEKSGTLGTNEAFVFYLLLKEGNIRIDLICFDDNFDHPLTTRLLNVVTIVPKNSPKSHIFPTKT